MNGIARSRREQRGWSAAKAKAQDPPGHWLEKDGVFYTAIYHPAALLRDPSKKPDTFADLRAIRAKIREVCPEAYS